MSGSTPTGTLPPPPILHQCLPSFQPPNLGLVPHIGGMALGGLENLKESPERIGLTIMGQYSLLFLPKLAARIGGRGCASGMGINASVCCRGRSTYPTWNQREWIDHEPWGIDLGRTSDAPTSSQISLFAGPQHHGSHWNNSTAESQFQKRSVNFYTAYGSWPPKRICFCSRIQQRANQDVHHNHLKQARYPVINFQLTVGVHGGLKKNQNWWFYGISTTSKIFDLKYLKLYFMISGECGKCQHVPWFHSSPCYI